MVFLKEIFKKVDFEKNWHTTNKYAKGVRALRGYFGQKRLLEPKTKNCLSPISFNWFNRRIMKFKISAFTTNFTIAMVTKMADKIGLKQRICQFGPNLRLFETDFLRIRYQHS